MPSSVSMKTPLRQAFILNTTNNAPCQPNKVAATRQAFPQDRTNDFLSQKPALAGYAFFYGVKHDNTYLNYKANIVAKTKPG